jgi:alanyl-tRNA synthetase
LGDHVAQKGSLNADDRLRFDFSHSKALSASELAQVEAEVNAFIRQNSPVETRIMTPDDARALGAQALFGEKYGDEVRVVSMGHLAGSGKGPMARPTAWNCAAAPMSRAPAISAPLSPWATAPRVPGCAGSRP